MNIINKLTLRHIKENKKRTIVTVIGIIISVAMITAVTTAFVSFMNYMKQDKIAMAGNWHYAFNDISAEDVKTIEKTENVNSVSIFNTEKLFDVINSKTGKTSTGYICAVNDKYYESFDIKLKEGLMPKGSNEIVVAKEFVKENNLDWKIGETVSLEEYTISSNDNVETYEDIETQSQPSIGTYKIVGFYEGNMYYNNFQYAFTALDNSSGTFEKAFVTADKISFGFYDEISAAAKSIGREGASSVQTTLIGLNGVFSKEDSSFFITVYGILGVVISVIVISSVALIYNAFAISLNEKSKYLGMLASVGATKKQKRGSIYYEGLILGAIGIPLGVLSGLGAMAITFKAISPLLNGKGLFSADLKYVVTPLSIIIGVIISALTIAISSYIPARKASKITPINAIKKSDSVKLKVKSLKTSKLTRMLFGFEGEIALKNIKRTGRKSRIITASIALSIILFLTVNSFSSMFGESIKLELESYDYNYGVTFNAGEQENADYKRVLSNHPSVEKIRYKALDILEGKDGDFKQYRTKTLTDTVEAPNSDFYVLMLDDASFKEFCNENGVKSDKYFNTEDFKAILLNDMILNNVSNQKIKELSPYKEKEVLGKSFEMSFSYSGENEEDAVQVSKSIELSDVLNKSNSSFVSADSMPYLIIPQGMYEKFFAERSNASRMIYYQACINTSDHKAYDEYIKKCMDDKLLANSFSEDITANAEMINNMVTIMNVFVYGFIATMTLVAIANIINTISTSMENRRREFAMIKSVGMHQKGFKKMISFESVFYGLKALLYGLPISVAIHFIMYALLSQSMGISSFAFPWQMYVVVVAAVFGIISLVLYYSVQKIKDDNIIETLKSDDN